MHKLAVVGSRSLKDNERAKILAKSLIGGLTSERGFGMIISGGAAGVDKWAEEVASELNISKRVFKPDWQRWGKSAGFRRNVDIISESDYVLILWDGSSKGTAHDIKIARKQEKPYVLYLWETDKWSLFESKSY